MLADDRHREIADALSAEFLRQRKSQEARLVGPAAHLAQQLLPFLAREAAMFEIRPRPFAAVIEEAFVVVLGLERLDLPIDEIVDLDQQVFDFVRNREIHGGNSLMVFERP